MLIGILSDTHGLLRQEVIDGFEGVHKPYSSLYDNREADMNFLFVAFGGALGAVARYVIRDSSFKKRGVLRCLEMN